MSKLLKFLIFFVSSIALAEPVVPDGEITNVVSTLYFYETVSAMREDLAEAYPKQDWSDTEAYSMCWRNAEKNIAVCDIYVARPQEVDGEHTLSLGHEVLHGVYGPKYHEWEE